MATKLSTVISTTIANGASLSAAICVANRRLVAIQMPAAWTAASLTFQGSMDNATYTDLYDGFGNEVTETVAASHGICLDVSKYAGWMYLKVRSGTGGTPVNQAADRTLTIGIMELIG